MACRHPRTSPRQRIRYVVEEILPDFAIALSMHDVDEANRRHGPTATGARSDHQGPGFYAWAIDVPAYSALEGDRIASDISDHFALGYPGSGLWNHTSHARVRHQLIWRAPGHWDHVHFGALDMNVTPVPPVRWP